MSSNKYLDNILNEKKSEFKTTEQKYPELWTAANKIIKEVKLNQRINDAAKELKSEATYKAQGILEALIDILQKAV